MIRGQQSTLLRHFPADVNVFLILLSVVTNEPLNQQRGFTQSAAEDREMSDDIACKDD